MLILPKGSKDFERHDTMHHFGLPPVSTQLFSFIPEIFAPSKPLHT